MASRTKPIMKSRYLALVEAARELDPSDGESFFREMGRRGRCLPATAKQAWREGWPQADMPPIRDVLLRDHVEARAARELRSDESTELEQRMQSAEKQEEIRARIDAARSRAEEGQMLAAARRCTTAAIENSLAAFEALGALGEAMNEKIVELAETLRDRKVGLKTVKLFVDIHHRYASVNASLVSSLHELIRAERLAMGEPGEIVGIQTGDPLDDVEDPEEIRSYLENEAERIRRCAIWEAGGSLGEPSN